jgi:hypothetical protein
MVSLVRLRYVCSCTITAAKIKVRFGICYTFFFPTLIALKLAQSREMVAAMVYLMQVGFKPIQALLKFQLNHKLF